MTLIKYHHYYSKLLNSFCGSKIYPLIWISTPTFYKFAFPFLALLSNRWYFREKTIGHFLSLSPWILWLFWWPPNRERLLRLSIRLAIHGSLWHNFSRQNLHRHTVMIKFDLFNCSFQERVKDKDSTFSACLKFHKHGRVLWQLILQVTNATQSLCCSAVLPVVCS